MKKTFLLGLGAQKAGTSWLHARIAASPGCDGSRMKEWHIWDALTCPDLSYFRTHRRFDIGLVPDALISTGTLRARMQDDPARYFAHFARSLRGDVQLTADITPTYNTLDAATLTRIRQGFARRDIAMRAVFLMRDPVERCWSALRMLHRKGDATKAAREGVPLGGDAGAALIAYARHDQARLRTDYPRTLAAIAASLPEEEVFIGTYETLFTESEQHRLETFLGLSPMPDFSRMRVNAAGSERPIPEDARRETARIFADIYEGVAATHPQITAAWARGSAPLASPRDPR